VTPTARWAAFQDLTQDARLLVDGGEHAFAEVVARGTHTVPLAAPDGDIASTGRVIEVPFCVDAPGVCQRLAVEDESAV
jgi:hypothetical protein